MAFVFVIIQKLASKAKPPGINFYLNPTSDILDLKSDLD